MSVQSFFPTGWKRRLALLAGLAGAVLVGAAVARAQAPRRVQLEPFAKLLGGGGPQIGVTIRDVTADDVRDDGLSSQSGAVVESVTGGSPAATAGLHAGDVVVAFDGEAVRSARQLTRLIDETPAGKAVAVAVSRAGSRVELKVTPESGAQPPGLKQFAGELPGFSVSRQPRMVEPGLAPFVLRQSPGRLGVQVQDLSGQLGTYFGSASGALVTSVNEGSPAVAAGLKAGDVITRVGNETVGNTADLRRVVAAASGTVSVTIVRDRKEQTLSVDVGARATSAPRYER
jgi:serine protease Do